MKKSLVSQLCFSLALFSLGVINAAAGYVSPNIAPRATAAYRLPPVPPAPVPGEWLVTKYADAGPGSLRQAISKAAPGDTVVTIAGLGIVNGRALNGDGFSDNLGGGIFNEGSLTVSNCLIAGNTAPTESVGNGFGGGIFTLGPLTVLNSTVRGNEASYAGGGICTFKSDNVRLEGCTISGNFAGIQGGGVNFQGLAARIKNCTISGNRTPADGTASALLHLVFENEAATLDLTACTIARNYGNPNGAIVMAALPGNPGSKTRMIGTLVAGNAAPNFFMDGNPVFQSLGNNLDSDGTSGLLNGVNGDLVGTGTAPLDARIGPLWNYGGPTWTHALLFCSPAVDAGACLDVDGNLLPTDQRGLPRPQGAACDIGAVETQLPRHY
ncbi:MAG: right-handed parallel beta-helix repeat-containing protein [Verrucomicrobia bacterium]|nr:right-handed parallel beta-helix repeat-containing protein [Verrucomicrobiota bacterium]